MSATIDYVMAKQNGGIFYLRNEDTDGAREIEGAVEYIRHVLEHYNMNPDEYEYRDTGVTQGIYGPYIQSERKDIYHAFIKHLIIEGKAYPCFLTQEEMDSILQKAYDHSKDSQKNLWIRREASVKDYTHNAEAFEEIRRQQLAKLEALANSIAKKEQGAKAILTQYNVLTTVKDQSGLLDTFVPGTKMRERGIGFSGGAMGKDNNGFSVIDNILAMGKKAHILDVKDDAEWLKFALINSGLGLLGFKNRSSLENYFSLFASYLMFDDAQLMVSQAFAESAQEIGKTNSVQEIHLYVINGVYIPQSYILEELYKHMQEIKTNGNFYKRNLSESTVRTQIYGYNVGSKYPGNTEADWRRESDNAVKQTKIKMYYMMNFADLVNQLSELMSQNF